MIELATLYKKTSNGAIQFWEISVFMEGVSGIIFTRYGQYGTLSPQETRDVVSSGKNIGKKNETSAYQQAVLEASAKWEKQLKKGYVQNIEDAKSGKTDKVIEGGVSPMLAHKFSEHAHKITYPC